MRTTLDAYSESGDATYALQFDDMDVNSRTGTLGVKLEGLFATEGGRLQPQVRLEYQRDFQADAFALTRYSDGLGPVYRADFTGFDRNRIVIGLGLVYRTNAGWSTRFEYRGLTGSDGSDNGANVTVEKGF